MSSEAMEAVLVGAGGRGIGAFGAWALANPDELKFTAVAEPDPDRRAKFAALHSIPPDRQFATWDDLFAHPRLAPVCINATMDAHHLESGVKAMDAGYDLFLEKPMADTADGCRDIVAAAERTGRLVQICTPLRYTPFYMKVKELMDSGAIGRVLAVSMAENVAFWHFAHSFVRGNWGDAEKTGPLILTKCCHDMDMARWLADAPPARVASQGALTHFHAGNAPDGAPARCTDGCPAEKTCPHFAPALYCTGDTDWPVSAVSVDTSADARWNAMRTGPYGRCVFRCDNTAVDQQNVSVEFTNGVVLDFTVRGNTVLPYRTVRVLGTEGEIQGHMEKGVVTVQRFAQQLWQKTEPVVHEPRSDDGAHGGGDGGALRHFIRCVREGDRAAIAHGLRIALEGHLLSFAAERARATRTVVDATEFLAGA